MLNLFADTFMNATLQNSQKHRENRSHWLPSERFENRSNAEIEAHNTARRRD